MLEYFSLVGNVFCFLLFLITKQETMFKYSVEVVIIKLP